MRVILGIGIGMMLQTNSIWNLGMFTRKLFGNALILIFALIFVLSGMASIAFGSSATFTSSKATYVSQGSPMSNYSYGEWIYVGNNESGTGRGYRSLVQFGMSFPPETIISSAVLQMYSGGSFGGGQDIRIQAFTSSWSERTVTWDTLPPQVYDLNSTTYCLGSGWKEWDVTGAVAMWTSGEWYNYGFYIRPTVSTELMYQAFASDDYSSSTYRPKLVVNYTIPSEPLELVESGCYVSPSTQNKGARVTVNYRIHNPNSSSVATWLGCSIRPGGGGDDGWINDSNDDKIVSASPGTNTYSRGFDIPSSASPPGLYRVWYAIKDGGMAGPNFDEFQRDDLTVTDYVDCLDLRIFASYWLDICEADRCEGSDITMDGQVDYADFAVFAEYWPGCAVVAGEISSDMVLVGGGE